jgi:predicted metal-dependent peptidase
LIHTLTPVSSQSAEQELEQCIVRVLREEPFFGHLLGSVIRRLDSQIPTAAVTLSPIGVSLVINPDFFIHDLSSDERCAVIKHEILHLVLKHLFRFGEKGKDHYRLNIAADLVVNQLVHPWPLPSSAITLSSFPELQLNPNKSVEYYYRRLESYATGNSGFDQVLRAKLADSHSHHGRWAASGGEGFTDNEHPESSTSSLAGDHAPPLSEDLAEILEQTFDRQLQRARSRLTSKQWGQVPGSLRSMLEQAARAADGQIDWKRTLRIFASAGYRTRIVATTRKRSKRFGTYPGVRIRRERRLAVVIDTSGSIDDATLAVFFSEIAKIYKTGADIVIIEADAGVKRSYLYKGKAPDQTHGGGGTDFNPAFEWMRLERQRFDGCIYLTDGYAEKPTVRPPCRLLWVITPNGRTGDHLPWGRQIRLDN